MLTLYSRKLPEAQWELVPDGALHSIRYLFYMATNQILHKRLYSFPRKSFNGYSLPTWLSEPGPILIRKFTRNYKSDPLVK